MTKIARYPMRILLVTATLAAPAAAQDGVRVGFGVRAGVNVSTMSLSDAQNFEEANPLTGFAGGVAVTIRMGNVVSIQPEAWYSQQGFEGVEGGTAVALSLDYLQLPALVTMTIPTRGRVRPIFFAGPVVSFEIECRAAIDDPSLVATVGCDDPGSVLGVVQRTTTDWGVLSGAGVEIAIGSVTLTLQGRYNHGLSNIDDGGVPDETARTRVWSFVTGASFGLRR